ncbi:MAG: phosphate ABC transporter permease PstA [Dehalococcoidia bacterium]|nr:phosphate ABC transporter permease PstA [Dehalococcoidia bacterium]
MIATSSRNRRRRKAIDTLATAGIIGAGAGAIVPLFAILIFLLLKGLPALNLQLFTQNPGPTGVAGGGIQNSIVGTAVLMALSLAIGLPFAIATGVYLAEYGRGRVGFVVRFLVDVLAGIPSITIGLFVYTVVVLRMGTFSALAGGLALALIMVPIISRVTEEMLLLVPQTMREASYALGVPKWRTVLTIVVPAARSGIMTGVILASARAAGEAAPLLFTSLGNNFRSTSITSPIDALPLRIFTYATGPFAYQHAQAWAASFILVAFVLVLSVSGRLLLLRGRR